MNKTFIVGILLAFATGAAGQAPTPRAGTAIPVDRATIKGAPYSAEFVTESVQTFSDGNRIVQRRTGRVSRDREGRVRREEDRASGGVAVTITDPVSRMSYTLDPETKTARQTSALLNIDMKYALDGLSREIKIGRLEQASRGARGSGAAPTPKAAAGGGGGRGRGAGAAAASDAVEEKLGDRTIEGVLASGVRRTTTIARGAIGNEQPILTVSETWTSPELQVQVLTDFSDPRTGRSTYRLLKITRADPDPALFQIPAGYTIMKVPPPVWIDK